MEIGLQYLSIVAAIVVPSLILIASLFVGYSLGRTIEGRESTEPTREAKRARRLLTVSALLFLSAVLIASLVALARSASSQERERVLSERQRYFGELKDRSHSIVSVKTSLREDLSGWDVRMELSGERTGEYHLQLELRVREPYDQNVLYAEEETLNLQAGSTVRSYFIDYDELIAKYHELVFGGGSVQVGVIEEEQLSIRLQPVLSDDEEIRLGDQVYVDLGQGMQQVLDAEDIEEALTQVYQSAIPVEFYIQGVEIEKRKP